MVLIRFAEDIKISHNNINDNRQIIIISSYFSRSLKVKVNNALKHRNGLKSGKK